jgi:hypothetical protein
MPMPAPTSGASTITDDAAAAGAKAPVAEAAGGSADRQRSSAMFGWWPAYITPVPIVFYTPENQFGFGAGVMATWQMPGAWKDRPSNVTVYGIYTTRAQTIVGASHELHFDDDRHVITQEFRYIDWPDRFYGFGNATRDSDREDFTDHYLQLESEYQARVYKRLYVGARHLWRASQTQNVQSEGRLATDKPRGVGDVTWSGAGPSLVWDTRQGLFWPVGGSLLRADATFYGRTLGADFNATLLRLDFRHYQPIWFGHVLALRFVSFGVTGAAPFQLVPSLGGSVLFRGWFLGRLRDRVLAATEAEYRVALTRRWSVAGFGSVGRVASSLSALSVRGLHVTGGAGVRFAVRPESRANFRLDVAYGDDVSIYFQFREAF